MTAQSLWPEWQAVKNRQCPATYISRPAPQAKKSIGFENRGIENRIGFHDTQYKSRPLNSFRIQDRPIAISASPSSCSHIETGDSSI
jgi:hypothetical protein